MEQSEFCLIAQKWHNSWLTKTKSMIFVFHKVWIRRFDSRQWFLGLLFWGSVIFKMCYFSPASRLEAVGIYFTISCVDKSIIALTLKRKTIWMKAGHSLRNFVALNSNCFKPACWGKSSTFWKWHCLRKIALDIQTPYPYLMNLVSNYLEKNILSNTAKINGI